MAWFSKTKKLKAPETQKKEASQAANLWQKCDGCSQVIYTQDWERHWNVCPTCGQHDPLPVHRRLELVLDPGSFQELDADLTPQDPLGFADTKKYRDRLRSVAKNSGLREAFVSGTGLVEGRSLSVGCFAFEFMGGSMGSVVGEKVARVFDRAYERRTPAIVFSSTGGARMQEGIFSLMQMAKTSAALNRFRAVRKPYVSVMLHPTTGGVAASFAWLGDVVIAEPKALIGFAGPRVIANTIRQELPDGFQRSEHLLAKGFIDRIVHRKDLRSEISRLIDYAGK